MSLSARMNWLKSLSISRSPALAPADNPARADEQLDEWKIQTIRKAISEDWILLSAKELTREERRAIRDHLELNTAALRDLIQQTHLQMRQR